MSQGERFAAIDVGSNTILLTVAEYDADSGRLTVIEEGEDQPRLGAGMSAIGALGEAAMSRAIQALTTMGDTCLRLNATRIQAVATAAVREAGNGDEFVQRARDAGIPLRVISPETEAALTFRSAAYRFPGDEPMLVADVGGGSLELIGAMGGSIRLCRSLPLGAVRLTEMHASSEELRAHLGQGLRGAIHTTEWAGARIVGSGGTFATLASMVLARRASGRHEIHGTQVSASEAKLLLESLDVMSPDQRRRTPGLRPERADIIVAGLAAVVELLSVTGSDVVTISGFGLRDGLLLEMAGLM
ncbi:MAG TPA: hypothetical protein VJ808_10340 [Gemmatimonadales bacterium]|nr:hypothetical protein [Gemmatimonadales bacterium]